MQTATSELNKKVEAIHQLKAGKIYVFDTFAVSEFNEGVLLDFDSFLEIYNILDTYSKNSATFGYISNRIHSYNVKVVDFIKARKLAGKTYPVAVVTYSMKDRGLFLFEKQLYKCEAKNFSKITDAAHWMESLSYSLN